MNENVTSNKGVRTPTEPAVLNDLRHNRGVAFTLAKAVAGQADVSSPGASLPPAVENLRAPPTTTAVAVARAAADDGVATRKADDPVQAVQDTIWQPAYPDPVS